MKKDRFFIYYSGSGKFKNLKSVRNVNYDGYLHNSEKKRVSFLFSTEAEKANFINDFQTGNPNLKIVRTHIQTSSQSTNQPARKQEDSRTPEVKRSETPEARKEEDSGNGNILLILAIGAGAFLFLGKKKKRK